MSEIWHDVLPAQQIEPGHHHVLIINDKAIAVFNLAGDYFAIEDFCPHQGLPLSEGAVENGSIECPFHGARFCLKTGDVQSPPACSGLNTFQTRVENEVVQVFI